MKKNNLVILIASSLFCAFGLKTTRASLCVASLRLLLKAFWLKTLFAFSSRQNPLQSLSNPDGTLNGKYWQEITLPGVHSDIGGGYANGYQNRDQNMAFYSMQTMVNAASEYGIKFNETPLNQMPTIEFNNLMNSYRLENINNQVNPSNQNLIKLNDLERIINNSSVHDSTYSGTGEWSNYSFGDRNIFYPNYQLKN